MKTYEYLIIGYGRLGRHLSHYLTLEGISHQIWTRAEGQKQLDLKLSQSQRVLLAIKDSDLKSFAENLPKEKLLFHFSGSLVIPGVYDLHPLMTFSQTLYSLENYRSIVFISSHPQFLDQNARQKLLPGLKNTIHIIQPEQKAIYHAYCVLGGNFTTLLIAKLLQGLGKLNIPDTAIKPYVEKIVENVLHNPQLALTGPLARKDFMTIKNNIEALTTDPYQQIYESFVRLKVPEFYNGELK